MNRELEQRRGEQAARLIGDPLLVEAFAAVETALRRQWEASSDSDAPVRERLWLMLKLLRRVHGLLTEAMDTGRMAEKQLASIETVHGSAETNSGFESTPGR